MDAFETRSYARHPRRPLALLVGMAVALAATLSPVCARAAGWVDAPAGSWYSEAVSWAASEGVMTGYGDGSNRFGPDDPLLREQEATALYRYLGKERVAVDTGLADVPAGQWYTRPINWAFATGTMTGYGGKGRFGVGNPLTREELASVMARICKADLAGTDASKFSALPDHDKTSSWAHDVMVWAVDKGVINGMGDGHGGRTLSPQGTVTRAQMAAVMMNSVRGGLLRQDGLSGSYAGVYEKYTKQTYRHDEGVVDRIASAAAPFETDGGYVPAGRVSDAISAVESCARSLKDSGEAISYEASDDSVLVTLSSGIPIVYVPPRRGVASSGDNAKMSILSFEPWKSEWNYTWKPDGAFTGELNLGAYGNLQDIGARSVASNLDNCSFAHDYEDSAVTFDKIASLGPNQIVLWNSHGGNLDSIGSIMMTGETDSSANLTKYVDDLVNKRIVSGYRGRLWFTGKYVEAYCGSLSGSFVYLNGCETGKDNRLASAFLKKGATAVVANSETIYVPYMDLMEHSILTKMSEINPSTDDYYTLKEALAVSKAENGSNDRVWYERQFNSVKDDKEDPSTPLIFGGSSAESFRLAHKTTQVTLSQAWATLYSDGELVFSDSKSADSGRTVVTQRKASKWTSAHTDSTWWDYATQVRRITSQCDIKVDVSSLYRMFGGHYNLTDISGLSRWDVSGVTDMGDLFYDCNKLTDLSPISGWDTSNVTDMTSMFAACSFANVNALSRWNTAKVTQAAWTFTDCENLIDVSGLAGWNVSSVTDMTGMFSNCCQMRDPSPLAGWNTSRVTSMRETFSGCTSLGNLGSLDGWSTSQVTNMLGMFGSTDENAGTSATPPSWYRG